LSASSILTPPATVPSDVSIPTPIPVRMMVLKGHSGNVLSAMFSPDGERIVTASDDKTARVWKRRRPEYWWGVAWLPEFWVTLILGVALLWSLRRDMLNLKTAGEPNSAPPQSPASPDQPGG